VNKLGGDVMNLEDLDAAARHLIALDAAARPGPWEANGNELYYGKPGPRVCHQQIPFAPDAALMAVARSWIKDLATEYLRLRGGEVLRVDNPGGEQPKIG
jgi:hypothetical protein